MEIHGTVYLLGCLLVIFPLSSTGNVEEELEKFMRGALDSIKQETEVKTEGNDVKNGYETNDAKNNSTEEIMVDNIGNFTQDNVTSNVAKGNPAFGQGIGSGYHGHLPRRQFGQSHGLRGQNGQSIIDTRAQRQYPGFGSPEVDGRHIGGQGVRHNSNLQQGNIGQNVEVPRVPDGRMGIPRPDGCLCNGPILNPCCYELPKGVIRRPDGHVPGGQFPQSKIPQGQYQIPQGQNPQGYVPGGHHHYPERQSGLQLPSDQNQHGQVLPPQTPIGLEYRGEFTCPVVNGNFPHPSDCSRFLQCAHYVAYDSPCPKGLLYDTTTGMCNWPDLVRCNSPTGTQFPNQIFNSTVIIPSTWNISWGKCRSLEVAVNAVFISVAQAVLGKPCPNTECQFPYIIVNCLK